MPTLVFLCVAYVLGATKEKQRSRTLHPHAAGSSLRGPSRIVNDPLGAAAMRVAFSRPAGSLGDGPVHNVSFYMYTDPALDHAWFANCVGFQQLINSSKNDNLAEVGLGPLLAGP